MEEAEESKQLNSESARLGGEKTGRGERGENFQKPGQTVIPHDDKAQEC